MKLESSGLLVLALLPSVYAACNVSGINQNVLTLKNPLIIRQ